MAKTHISASSKQLIIKRSKGYCEYCKCPSDFSTELFSIEHIIPRSKSGSNELDNLAYACIGCNIYKSDKTEFIDVVSQAISILYNPRKMNWTDHFIWDESLTIIIGKTAIGRATTEGLKLNRTPVKNLRRALISIGEHPPSEE
ncbi:HNH endonuclease signature motif containing protein [Arcicella sp. LKC2W]|uniref:HNH endonuclease n=1 Tax=Arcicella sp. LKC2W TaxID=2984198 RepID=UPI002B1F73B9|nr:HNH endonuclease signature motif containing protein [Arcicella sp. LKC2W]MEA5459068.1 HNH endonuclease signature motif containing protein [Arcicella sp. LKC2W]